MKLLNLISAFCTSAVFLLNTQANAAITNNAATSTLAYHLATNATGRAAGYTGGYREQLEFSAPYATNANQLARFTNAAWANTFWLKHVTGLSATPIGFTNVLGGQGLPTMISPRHYLCATHMHCEDYTLAFLDTNNFTYFRKVLQRLDLTNDITVGILDQDLPPSVGYLPVLPANYTNYLPANSTAILQGIGMNQDFCLFGEPMNFGHGKIVAWNSALNVPSGLHTNWNVGLRGGDSSNPAMILIRNQLVLVSHNYFANSGPNYACYLDAINAAMHQLSKKYNTRTDYQLTTYNLTNWPMVK